MSRRLIAIFGVGAVLFIVLTVLAHFNTPLSGDDAVISWVQSFDFPFIDDILQVASLAGGTWPAIATVTLVALFLLYKKRRREALFVATVPALAALLNYVIKNLTDRARPGDDPLGGGLSFPSGHATYALVFFGLLAFLAPRLINKLALVRLVQIFMVLMIVLVSVSRIYMEEHWPSDVLGSIIFGGMLLMAVTALYDKLTAKGG